MMQIVRKTPLIKFLITLFLLAGFSGWQVCDCWDGDDFEDLSHHHFEKNGLNAYTIGVCKEDKFHVQHLLKLDVAFSQQINFTAPVTSFVQRVTPQSCSYTAAFQSSFHSRAPPA
jgi:hypothetical protein